MPSRTGRVARFQKNFDCVRSTDASLVADPRHTIAEIVERVAILHVAETARRVLLIASTHGGFVWIGAP